MSPEEYAAMVTSIRRTWPQHTTWPEEEAADCYPMFIHIPEASALAALDSFVRLGGRWAPLPHQLAAAGRDHQRRSPVVRGLPDGGGVSWRVFAEAEFGEYRPLAESIRKDADES